MVFRRLALDGLSLASGLAIPLLWAASGFAQAPQPAQRNIARPTVSPYVNLGNTGRNSGLNYFGQVRPQQQFRSFGTGVQGQIQQMQSQLGLPSPAIDPTGRQATSTTGHATMFMNTGGYFSAGGSGGGMGGGGPRPSRGASQAGRGR